MLLNITYLTRDYYGGGRSGGFPFWPKSAIFCKVNNFPRYNKNPPTQLFGFLGVWVMTLCTLLLIIICPINIFNYSFEQYMQNYTNCDTEDSIFEKK